MLQVMLCSLQIQKIFCSSSNDFEKKVCFLTQYKKVWRKVFWLVQNKQRQLKVTYNIFGVYKRTTNCFIGSQPVWPQDQFGPKHNLDQGTFRTQEFFSPKHISTHYILAREPNF